MINDKKKNDISYTIGQRYTQNTQTKKTTNIPHIHKVRVHHVWRYQTF